MIFFPVKKMCYHPKFFRLNIITLWTKFSNKLGCRLILQLDSIFFLLDMNFGKSIIGLQFFFKSSIFAKFQKYEISITMSSLKSSNFEFLLSKIIREI